MQPQHARSNASRPPRARARLPAPVLRPTPLVLSLICLGLTPALAQTLPTGLTPTPAVTAETAGATMTVRQSTQRAIAQWQAFSIGAGGTVNVVQPGSASVLLNRVVGGQASNIAGNLNANGHVYLINPAGVLFGPTSSVNVGGLVASTLDITDDNAFLNGSSRLVFQRAAGNNAAVTNQGVINVGEGGIAALMGAQVTNSGTIGVARGSAGLVSARTVTLDFEGDGLTRFTIPADSLDALAAATNTGVVTADGGRIAMQAASTAKAQVVNQAGVLRARTLDARSGEIVLGAGIGTGIDNLNSMRVAGTVDASGGSGAGGRIDIGAGALTVAGASLDASGASGGQIVTSGHRVTIDDQVQVNAGGTAGNGQWTVNSDQDILVTATAPDDAPIFMGGIINAGALGRALGRNTDVTLNSNATPTPFDNNGYSGGFGVTFLDAPITKDAGGDVTFSVNSNRYVALQQANLSSTSGALNVNLNADAKGALSSAPAPVTSVNTASGGAVLMAQSTIETNGGSIRAYGQSDPANGRARGVVLPNGQYQPDGVQVGDTLLSTCAAGQAACTGAGDISLRGEGVTLQIEGTESISGNGVGVHGSVLRTGSGAVTLDGRGGIGASGVRLDSAGRLYQGRIESASGNVSLRGDTRGWTAADPVVMPQVQFDGANSDGDAGGGGGVVVADAVIATGGDVRIEGQGADLTALGAQAAFRSALLANSNSATMGSSHGVALFDSDVGAGAGRRIDIIGTAGSNGFTAVRQAGVISVVPDTRSAYGVTVDASFGRGAVTAKGGSITLDANGTDVNLGYTDDSEGGPIALLDAYSDTGQGGSISVTGRNLLVTNDYTEEATPAFIDARGATGGGTVALRASGDMGIDQNASIRADATGATGNGGRIEAVAQGDLRSHGVYGARAGTGGGNGGFVETSGRNVDLRGIRVDAGAPAGNAGLWLVDPFDITVAHGDAAGTLPAQPFVPLASSTVQDGDINAALNSGTNVTITTGAPAANSFTGSIYLDRGVDINLGTATSTAPLTLRLEAQRDIQSLARDTQIRSTGTQPLNVEFAAGLGPDGGSIDYGGGILTNGGNVAMTALGGRFDPCTICLTATTIDTRTGGSDANAGGSVSLQGVQSTAAIGEGGISTDAVVDLYDTSISSSTGNVEVSGRAAIGTGVRILALDAAAPTGIRTTSGSIAVTGIGAYSSNSSDGPGHGVSIDGAVLRTTDGSIDVRGLRTGGPDPAPPPLAPLVVLPEPPGNGRGIGVLMANGALATSTGSGRIAVTGETQGDGAGLLLTGAATDVSGAPVPASRIDGNSLVTLRAANDGSSDALALDGTVRAGQVLNLRPGGVDQASGAGVDRTANPITLGGSGGTGFDISSDELARLDAGALVVGSNTHAGSITVNAAVNSSVPLTLQNGGGGGITLGAPVTAPQLGLISGGSITQAAGEAITAGTLLARSINGDVILADPANNVSASTLGGGAAGRFEYVNAGSLRVGAVSVVGWDAAGEAPLPVTATSMAADTLLVRTLSGDLLLDTAVSSVGGADLVAANTFQNPGGGSLGGAPWRVWADTWVGETRGGLAGSGAFPNYYNCAFLGACGVTVTPADNHFIYRQQPTATVTIGSFQRTVGTANPPFGFTVSGLILGDTGAGIGGTTSSPADAASPPGSYPVDGSFTSAEGYAINVVPGQLRVVALEVVPPPPVPPAAPPPAPREAPRADILPRFVDVLREEPTTWLYDRNIGIAPICLASSAPLTGDRAVQGNDVLARQWSMVRTRPNLTSCLDTERTNSCGDF